jgi:two-component system, chemotaxis family, sensor kinase CheA
MPDTANRNGGETALRERIDALATQLVLEGPVAGLATDLAGLSELAAQHGCTETSRIASELAERAGSAAPAELEDELRQGIAHLQEALAAEADPAVPSPFVWDPEPPAAPPNPLAQDPELIGDFLVEAREHLASIESCVLLIEKNPSDLEAIHSVFRGFHTIKGLAGFLEFHEIRDVAHDVETLLDLARNERLAMIADVIDVVLESADYLKESVAAVESALGGVAVPAADPSALRARIRSVTETGETPEPSTAPGSVPPPPSGVREPAEAARPTAPAGKSGDVLSVRVDTAKLDYLLDMVGEMVIAQSLVRHNPGLASLPDTRLQGDLAQLARITGEVQRTTMSMRMLPIGQLFQRTARLVRDLARKAGKVVELETVGEETELDKNIAEELADPLMHMVRNAIDHGIELPQARTAAGKPATARLRLAAYHQGGQIVVEIGDDGRGLDREKILAKAREKGLVEDGAVLSDSEVHHLIFEPGFSTAAQVTDISGRGVGMDVVRKHVQKLRGRIDIQSRAGSGATFFLKLPLTLAIIEGLVVMVGAYRYIVPIFSVREMFRPAPGAVATVQGRDEMVLVRGRLLPIVRLYRRFGVRPRSEDPYQGLLVVAECEGRQFCLLVDDLVGKQEVVIKSLGESLKNIAGVAGAAILGDGRVGLILDMEGVLRGATHE